jgi:hypothetical protein
MRSIWIALLLHLNFTFVKKLFRLNQKLIIEFPHSISFSIKREDLIHPFVSGNKFRKLKYNLLQDKHFSQQLKKLVKALFNNTMRIPGGNSGVDNSQFFKITLLTLNIQIPLKGTEFG